MKRIPVQTKKRGKATRETHLGRLILFVEGKSELAYFNALKEMVRQDRYSNLEPVNCKGKTATNVLHRAEKFFQSNPRAADHRDDAKYLVFDCDAPPEIGELIREMRKKGYKTLYSNACFETWLLMHVEDVKQKYTVEEAEDRLTKWLGARYKKGDAKQIQRIIEGKNIAKAIERAQARCKQNADKKYNICRDVPDMNPCTSVHVLVQELLPNNDQ